MHYQIEDNSMDFEDMALKLCFMSLENIKWSCLYSGLGIIHSITEKELKKLTKSTDYSDVDRELMENAVFLKCIYKKGKPTFSAPPEEIINPGKYMWNFKNFNKLITPSSQAFGILSLCNASKVHSKNSPILSDFMFKNAEIYYDFTTTYMRNNEGFYITIEDKTKFLNDKLKIKEQKKDAKMLEQFFIHEAFLALHNVQLEKSKNKEAVNCKYINEAKNIFNYLFESYPTILQLPSKEISLCISSLSRCCSMVEDSQLIVFYQHYIALLSAELETRIKITGEVERNYDDFSVSSLITHFRVASALYESYKKTDIVKFKDTSIRIYKYLENFFDESNGLFIQGDPSELYYSLRDIAEILKGLLLYFKATDKYFIKDMLIKFYSAAIEKSGIVQCMNFKDTTLLGKNFNLPACIPRVEENIKAPVFLKSFRISNKNPNIQTETKHFHSYYSLYASYIFLYYILPIIKVPDLQLEPIYEKKGSQYSSLSSENNELV